MPLRDVMVIRKRLCLFTNPESNPDPDPDTDPDPNHMRGDMVITKKNTSTNEGPRLLFCN